ncbi:hypothetical protein [Streptomyces sp. NPDC091217]|uniref:hypothetical protein n=1 Tax=Streptomyces sp. NPDC091217 TaxID=3365975 RepID=UPI003824FD4E
MKSSLASARLAGGLIDDLEREDNERGPEPDETEGQLLRLVIPHTSAGQVRLPLNGGGSQCAVCGGWFGVTFWTCDACQSLRQLFSALGRFSR